MATPDRVLSTVPQAVSDLQRRVQYIDQRIQSPVNLASNIAFASGLGLSTTHAVFASVSIPVPYGYSSVMVIANVSAQAKNSTGSSSKLWVQPNVSSGILGGDGFFPYRTIPAGSVDSLTETQIITITDLTEDMLIAAQCKAWVDTGTWAADATYNSFAVRAACWFMR